MADDKNLITWNDESSKTTAMQQHSDSINEYAGVTKASHYRDFKDIESNRSVRPGFTSHDTMRSDQKKRFRTSKSALSRCAWTHTTKLELSET